MSRADRIDVARSNLVTDFAAVSAHYPAETQQCLANTQTVADTRTAFTALPTPTTTTGQVEVWQQDTLDAAWSLQQQGYRPLVLNMASDVCPGGGWKQGASAQEESLCYRSWLYPSLETVKYPLDTYQVIYSPSVCVFRAGPEQKYARYRWNDCGFMAFVSAAALRRPRLVSGRYRPADREVMRQKMEGLFQVALRYGHDSLVLGAWGCGAFYNPPEEVAALFAEVCSRYGSQFRRIIFAIIDGSRSNNYDVFSRVLRQQKAPVY